MAPRPPSVSVTHATPSAGRTFYLANMMLTMGSYKVDELMIANNTMMFEVADCSYR